MEGSAAKESTPEELEAALIKLGEVKGKERAEVKSVREVAHRLMKEVKEAKEARHNAEKDAEKKSTKPVFRMCTAREVQEVLEKLDRPLYPEDDQWVA